MIVSDEQEDVWRPLRGRSRAQKRSRKISANIDSAIRFM